MQTALDRRTFLKGAAAAGGGLASMGAVERLVARDALGKPRRRSAAAVRPAAPRAPTSAASRCSRCPPASPT